MNDFWNHLILDNTVKKYIGVFFAILIGILIKRILSQFIAGQLFRAATTLDKRIDKTSFVKLLLNPLEIFLVSFIAIVAIDKLRFPSVLDGDLSRCN